MSQPDRKRSFMPLVKYDKPNATKRVWRRIYRLRDERTTVEHKMWLDSYTRRPMGSETLLTVHRATDGAPIQISDKLLVPFDEVVEDDKEDCVEHVRHAKFDFGLYPSLADFEAAEVPREPAAAPQASVPRAQANPNAAEVSTLSR